jgi:hypothetical protein
MLEVTIFATPKRFTGQFDRIQRNAIESWIALGPAVEVILIGDDDGTAAICREHGLQHVANVATTDGGIPLLSDLWRIGQQHAQAPIACFVNADIILMDDFVAATRRVSAHFGAFLMIGQRWDLELTQRLDDLEDPWAHTLRTDTMRLGVLNSPLWVDYFAFPVGQYPDLLPCVIGRPGYDHWIVWHTLQRGVPVVDATDAVLAVHQHHDYSHGGGKRAVYNGRDAEYNFGLIGGRSHLRHIGHATQRLTVDGRIVAARGMKYATSALHARFAGVIGATSSVRHRLGLNAELLQRLSRSNVPCAGAAAADDTIPTAHRATTRRRSRR